MKIYKVTNAQLKALLEAGSITVGGVTYTYNSEDVYVVTDGFPEYSLSKNSEDPSFVTLSKDGIVVASTQITEALHALDSDHADSLFEEIDNKAAYETVKSIRNKTVAPLVTADTVLTADLAKNIVAVGYLKTGTNDSNERWFVMNDSTLYQTASDQAIQLFRWDAADTLDVYTAVWYIGKKWSEKEDYSTTLSDDSVVPLMKNPTTVYANNSAGNLTMLGYAPVSGIGTLILRDSNGKAQVATPTDSDNKLTIATKEYVDNHSSGLTLTDNEDGTVTLNIV